MPRSNVLGVWLHETKLGELEKLRGGDLRLRFDPSIVSSYGVGTHLVSLALPLTTKRVQGDKLKLFVRGLLPEPPMRALIESRDRVPLDDDFALLRSLGGECAGALQFLPDEEEPSAGRLRHLSPAEVASIVSGLPTLDTPDGLPVGASLGGVQAKVLLTRTAQGWAWPASGAMSTHLIKPAPLNGAGLPSLIEAEFWAGQLARSVDVPAANSALDTFGDRRSLVVTRYDRRDGRRFHQEDFTQALSLRPSDKYELGTTRPGRLLRIARLAGPLAIDETEFLRSLLLAVTFNAVIGNSDAHSKNYSVLISGDGSVALAPLYDAAPIMLMDSNYRYAGQAIDGQTRLAFVTTSHLVREAATWGLDAEDAEEVVTSLAARIAEKASRVELTPELADLSVRVSARAEAFARPGHP